MFVGHFCPPGSDSGLQIRIRLPPSELPCNVLWLWLAGPPLQAPICLWRGWEVVARSPEKSWQPAPQMCVAWPWKHRCCGSEMFIPDPGSDFIPSQIRIFSIPDPGSTSKNLSILTQKNCFLSSRKYDLGCSSQVRIRIFYPSRIPGSKRHRIPDPGSRIRIRNTEKQKMIYQDLTLTKKVPDKLDPDQQLLGSVADLVLFWPLVVFIELRWELWKPMSS